MNDLPLPSSNVGSTAQDTSAGNATALPTSDAGGSIHPPTISIASKETEVVSETGAEVPPIREVGQDQDLPKEVVAVGVTVQPTSVAIPPKVSQLGVKPSGPNVSLGTGSTVVLPLTNEKITQGLHQSVAHSFRWLAEWCKRKLKQLHRTLVKSS